ncbi:MAG: peptidoglycan editing factor PgeF [Pseudorhodoplanes sp.]|uniref:peptidoglycan editing factor PgeF n=1 Tax=Pseudorhodoplanes sp. TaxID=1934341 RepID=UPI003D0EFA14
MKVHAATLSELDGIRHAFFTRDGGVSGGIYASLNSGVGSGDDAAHVAENRARMARDLNVDPARLITAFQIHSPNVVVAERPWTVATRPRADAIVTRTPGLAIGVSTADCGPLLFADAAARVIGAAHAGWRGAFSGVIEGTIAAMEKLGADRSRMTVALGPLIRKQNYEVSQNFVDEFLRAERDHARFFSPAARDGHAMFDLPGFIAWRLQRSGIGRFEDIGLCTYADPDRFYSYRRSVHRKEPDYGRHVNAIVLTDEVPASSAGPSG